jgi:hypothetical protein
MVHVHAGDRFRYRGAVYAVAIMESWAGAQNEAASLAQRLGGGITALEVRLALSATPPSVLFRTPTRERAHEAARALEAGGIPAVALDLAEVLPVERMVHLHRFTLDARGLGADAKGPTLAYGDIVALVRVAAETSIVRTTREKETETIRGRRTEVDVEHTRAEHSVEQALFLFVPGEGVPWVLRAGEARYLALGAELRPTAMENFLVTVALLRERAPQAVYDERFALHPLSRHAQTHVRGHDSAAPELGDAGVDVRVHLLARALVRSGGEGPYR